MIEGVGSQAAGGWEQSYWEEGGTPREEGA